MTDPTHENEPHELPLTKQLRLQRRHAVLELRRFAGLYLCRVTTPTHVKTLKISAKNLMQAQAIAIDATHEYGDKIGRWHVVPWITPPPNDKEARTP